jgi:hypothetical protein
MHHRSRAWIRRRLQSLALLELLNVPLQHLIWFDVLGFPITAPNLVGFALFAILLVEGASYWIVKLRQPAGSALPGAPAFVAARRGNFILLTAGLLYVGWSVARDPGTPNLLGLGFGLFAVLEHVNYFYVQLMYDNAEDLRYLRTRGLRRSHLARDLTQR